MKKEKNADNSVNSKFGEKKIQKHMKKKTI